MSDTTAVPVLVHSATRDPVEALNSLLRNAGLAVHCTWIPAIPELGDAFEQLNPDLVLSCVPTAADLKAITTIRDRVAPAVPLVVVRGQLSTDATAQDIQGGARDTVSLGSPAHLQAVIRRELGAYRAARALALAQRASQDARKQLDALLRRSNDAIAQVQEGIVVNANASWLELYGYADASALIGQPVMDLFDLQAQAPLKGALAACLSGRWADLPLKAAAQLADGSSLEIEVMLAAGEYDGAPCVQLIVPSHRQRQEHAQKAEPVEAASHDAITGLWQRRDLLGQIAQRLAKPPSAGVRCCVVVQLDGFPMMARDCGVAMTEESLTQFAALVRGMLGPHDLAGHFGASSLLLLLERGNARDAEAWCRGLVERVAKQPFKSGTRRHEATCSAGIALLAGHSPDLDAAVQEALESVRKCQERGGGMVQKSERVEQDARVQAYDEVWVKHIKAALAENRFHLVQQPVVPLGGGQEKFFDVAVRMLDNQAREVLPSEFLPAAERNDLMRVIDRWVLGAALGLIARRHPDQLFVRLSRDSVVDESLADWIDSLLKSTLAEPQRLCLQVSEHVVERHADAVQRLQKEMRARRVRLALDKYGSGRDSPAVLARFTPDYVKIDGSLMQGIVGNPELQQRVRSLAEAASKLDIKTIAERIEDANTMAVVWQLGVHYIQGFLVNAPEEVVLKS